MTGRWSWIFRLLTRRLWFRAALFGVGAVITALAASVVTPEVPEALTDLVGIDAVRDILDVLASSMLAVATFSLGTMVSAFAAAATTATPRAATLLVEDATSQNVLSTFVGAFIFSLVGLIALGTGFYGPAGRLVLFAVTLLVVAVVLVTFFRWIDYLSRLGRLSRTLDAVEHAASGAVRDRVRLPHLGGVAEDGAAAARHAVAADTVGYVQHIDLGILQAAADEAAGRIVVRCLPGSFVDPTKALLHATFEPDDEAAVSLREAFIIGRRRSYDQDPRFGLVVLSEVASRALSPGINDPGTAIDVIGRSVRILSLLVEGAEAEKPSCPLVHVPAVSVDDLFDDVFGPLARDAAGLVEVGIRLQKALAALARLDTVFAGPATRHARRALALAEESLVLEDDKVLLRGLAAEVGADPA